MSPAPYSRDLTPREQQTYDEVVAEVGQEFQRDLTKREMTQIRRRIIRDEWPAEWIVNELLGRD